MAKENYMTIKELCAKYDYHEVTIRKLLANNRIKFRMENRKPVIVISEESFIEYLANSGKKKPKK